MVIFSNNFVEQMKNIRPMDKDLDGLIKSTYETGRCDIEAFKVIWRKLNIKFSDIKEKLDINKVSTDKSKREFPIKFKEDIDVICKHLEGIGVLSQKVPYTDKSMSQSDELILINGLTQLALDMNKIYINNIKYIRELGYDETMLQKARKLFKPLAKLFLTLKLATGLSLSTQESSISEAQKQDNLKPFIEQYNKTHVNIPELGLIKVPDGYELYAVRDSALVTSYTPTGEGLKAGRLSDGTAYPQTGLTSTGHDALHDFSGVATADMPKNKKALDKLSEKEKNAIMSTLIPKGSIVFVDGIGWVIADDTGATPLKNAKRGIAQLDIRESNFDTAVKNGVRRRNAYIFVKKSDESDYKKVLEARNMYKQGMDKFFKKV